MAGIFRQMVSDTDGIVDVNYFAMFSLLALVIFSLLVLNGLSIYGWHIGKPFDPTPAATAISLVCGAFAVTIGAMGTYERMCGRIAARAGEVQQ